MHSPSSECRPYVRRGAMLLATLAALAGCAGTHEGEPPPATAATEPEHTPVIEKERTMPFSRESPAPVPEQTSPQAAAASPTPGILPTLQPTSESATKSQPQSDVGTASMPSDLELASRVRDAIIDAEGLSLTARNVNITANEGLVTLRGRVASAREKANLEQIATDAARPGKVVSELQVGK
jgi:hypothetical protein